MIRIKNLTKRFGEQEVLKGINLLISPGTINGLIGPNGSGKSTLIKSILGLVIPDRGEILFNNRNIIGEWEYRKEIGYMPQIAHYPDNIRVSELIKMISDIRGVKKDPAFLLEHFDLKQAERKKMKQLSGGMRQKVNLVVSVLFDSPVLIFDEPTVGLDPVSRIKFKDFIKEEQQRGKTILFTSHLTSEIQETADNIIFLLDGQVFFNGPVSEMMNSQQEDNLERAAAKILQNFSKEQNHAKGI